MKEAIKEIVGKTIKGVIVTEGKESPQSQVFLVFSDNTYYELYTPGSTTISGAGGIDKGGMQKARDYASRSPNEIVLDSED